MRIYAQLTQEQRYQNYALMKAVHTQAGTATIVSVQKFTIRREMRRNRGMRGYRPKQAHQLALHWHQGKAQCRISSDDWHLVEEPLREYWSPEQIRLWLAQEEWVFISHERIYLHILEGKYQGGYLYRHLRCQKPRRKRYGSYDH